MGFAKAVLLEILIWSAPSADFVHKTFYATPSLLVQTGFQNPSDSLNTAMQLAFDALAKRRTKFLFRCQRARRP